MTHQPYRGAHVPLVITSNLSTVILVSSVARVTLEYSPPFRRVHAVLERKFFNARLYVAG